MPGPFMRGALILPEMAAPATPPAGRVALYSVDGSSLLLKDDAGNVTTLGAAGAVSGTKTSALTTATTLDGTEPVPVVQGGVTKQTTTQDIADLAAAGGSGGYYAQRKVEATQSNTTVTGASITDLAVAGVVPGTYRINCALVWRSTNVGTGAGFWVNCSGGAVSRNVGHVYGVSTGTTATTGVQDQATVAATFQMVEARAWRANNTDPGPFGGTDTVNADILVYLEAVIVVTTTTTVQIMFDSETAATGVSVEPGSSLTMVQAP